MRTSILLAILATACTTQTPGDDVTDPDLDGKADGFSPIAEGTLGWTAPTTVEFANSDGNPVQMVYVSFEIGGDADITLETKNPTESGLDTILYLYEPTPDKWGSSLYRDDDSGRGALSKLTVHLQAGAYRVLVRRKSADGTPSVDVVGTCSGNCAPPPHGCTTTEPRTATPELFIGPDAWQTNIEAAIDSATKSLDVQMYLFTVTDIANHLIAAQQRGVALRVLTDSTQVANNARVKALLDGAGIANHINPPTFSYDHAKYMIIDGVRAVILSGNFNALAVQTTGGGERNYAFIDRDLDDVADLQAIYEADWNAGPEPDLSCTRLIVSPLNTSDRILAHVNGATATLDIEVLYLDDTDLQAAIVAAAQRGVAVRIMLSDPVKNPQNTATQTFFKDKGIEAKFLIANYLHAKMIMADGVPMVGSENMSQTSWTKNREVGALLFERDPASKIQVQYEADWAAAVETP